MIGATVGSYRVVSRIGVGGMGAVYLAVHPLMGRQAAVKMLLPQFSGERDLVERFFQEARATALVGHPGIVDIFDFGTTDDGHAYLVMEYLEGQSLAVLLHRDRLQTPLAAAQIGRQVASAVGAAHAKGVIHRDLKPDNLFLVPDRDHVSGSRVKVLDFGIAKLARASIAARVHTTTGTALGTPKYMAPEQCLDAGSVDGRADVYALGCILFEMVCGRPPFLAESQAQMLAKQLKSQPPRPRDLEPGVPAAFEALILACLAKQPAARPQTMEDVADSLAAIVARELDEPKESQSDERTRMVEQAGPSPGKRRPGQRAPEPEPETPDRATTGGLVLDQLIEGLPDDESLAPAKPAFVDDGGLPVLTMSALDGPMAAALAAPSTTSSQLNASSIRSPAPYAPRRLSRPVLGALLGGATILLGILTWAIARAPSPDVGPKIALEESPPLKVDPAVRATVTTPPPPALIVRASQPDAAPPDAGRPDAAPPDAEPYVPTPYVATPGPPPDDEPPERAAPVVRPPVVRPPVVRPAGRPPRKVVPKEPRTPRQTKPAAPAGPLEDGAIDPFAD